ncbi:MAG: fibronectin type III domain-containing protein [Saprospiraceae bacterium]
MLKRLINLSLILFFSSFCLLTFGQNATGLKPIPAQIQKAINDRENFQSASVFQAAKLPMDAKYSSKITRGVQLSLDADQVALLFRERPVFLSLSVPSPDGTDITLDLEAVDILASGFYVETNEEAKVAYTNGVYYRGIVHGDFNSLAAISIFDDEIIGTYSSETYGNVNVVPTESDRNQYLIFSDRDAKIDKPFACGAIEPEDFSSQIEGILNDHTAGSRDVRCIKVYIEGDYALKVNKGSVANATDYLTGLFNNVSTLYANEQITIAISQIFVWNTQDSYSTTNSSTALNEFKAARPNVNGDLAHLAALGGNNIGGIAWVNALCGTFKYAYSNISSSYQNVPTYSWTIMVFTHEMGHNIVSPHTHSCSWSGGAIDNCYTPEGSCNPGPPPVNGGTIMSYCHLTNNGINLANGFGPLPGNLIRARFNQVNCLGTCSEGAPVCSTPSNVTATNITSSTATISWGAVSGALSYEIQWKLNSASNWTTVTTSNTSTSLTGLANNTAYNYRVRTICSGETASAYSATGTFTTGQQSSCGTPSNVLVSNILTTTATITWSAVPGAVSYTLQVKPVSLNTWTSFTTTAAGLNISSLVANTAYNYQVRTNCSGGVSSPYSTIGTFTTSGNVNCPTPINVFASDITTVSASVSWSAVAGANNYTLQVKPASSNTWISFTSIGTTVNVTGLITNTAYNFQVRSNCAAGSGSYSPMGTFTTTGNVVCNPPSNFTVSNLTQTGAFVSWATVSGAQSYILQWRLSSNQSWTTVNTGANSVTLSNLQANTVYIYKVKSVCSASNSSAYSADQTFTTAANGNGAYCASKGNVATQEWVSRVKLANINRVSGSDGGYINTNLAVNVSRNSSYSFQFSVGKSSGNYNIEYFRIWIDYNNDGDFTDVDETVVSLATSSTVSQSYTLVIPGTATIGQTRMRVSVKRGAYPTACEVFANGEVEDYIINITQSGNLPSGILVSETDLSVSAYPNPMTAYLTIDISNAEAGKLNVEVFNILGQLIRTEEFDILGGQNQVALNTSDYTSGLYHMVVKQANKSATIKVMKQ